MEVRYRIPHELYKSATINNKVAQNKLTKTIVEKFKIAVKLSYWFGKWSYFLGFRAFFRHNFFPNPNAEIRAWLIGLNKLFSCLFFC